MQNLRLELEKLSLTHDLRLTRLLYTPFIFQNVARKKINSIINSIKRKRDIHIKLDIILYIRFFSQITLYLSDLAELHENLESLWSIRASNRDEI